MYFFWYLWICEYLARMCACRPSIFVASLSQYEREIRVIFGCVVSLRECVHASKTYKQTVSKSVYCLCVVSSSDRLNSCCPSPVRTVGHVTSWRSMNKWRRMMDMDGAGKKEKQENGLREYRREHFRLSGMAIEPFILQDTLFDKRGHKTNTYSTECQEEAHNSFF